MTLFNSLNFVILGTWIQDSKHPKLLMDLVYISLYDLSIYIDDIEIEIDDIDIDIDI